MSDAVIRHLRRSIFLFLACHHGMLPWLLWVDKAGQDLLKASLTCWHFQTYFRRPHPRIVEAWKIYQSAVANSEKILMRKVISKFQAISLGPDRSHDQNSACEYIGALPRTPSRLDVVLSNYCSCFDAHEAWRGDGQWSIKGQRFYGLLRFDEQFVCRAHISPVVAQGCYSTPLKERPRKVSEMMLLGLSHSLAIRWRFSDVSTSAASSPGSASSNDQDAKLSSLLRLEEFSCLRNDEDGPFTKKHVAPRFLLNFWFASLLRCFGHMLQQEGPGCSFRAPRGGFTSISDLQLLVVIAGVDFMPELRYQELLCPVIGGLSCRKGLWAGTYITAYEFVTCSFGFSVARFACHFVVAPVWHQEARKRARAHFQAGTVDIKECGPHLLGTLVTLVWCKLHVNFRYALGRTEGRAVLEVLPDLLLCHGSSRRIWRDPETGIKFKTGTECFLAPLWEDICDGVAWLFSTCSCWGKGALPFHCAVWKCRLTMTHLAPCLDVEVLRSKHLEVEEFPAPW